MPPDTHCVIEDSGRVFGYVTHWNRCLLDGGTECWKATSSPSQYALAHCGDTLTAEGTLVKTANIGGGSGHAPGTNGATSAARWYQDTSTQLARARYGEDEHGIWFAGALWPDVSAEDIARLRASGLSGDWRWIGDEGHYDFIGSCMVNVPGLPLYRAASAGDHPNIVGRSIEVPATDADCSECDKVTNVSAKTADASFRTIELGEQGVAFEAVLLTEGVPTSDGRLIKQGATYWRELPLSLMAQTKTAGGHDGAEIAGRIDHIWRDGDNIMGSGVMDTGAHGKEITRLIGEETLRGISIDGAVENPDDMSYDEELGQIQFEAIQIMGATVTPFPAHSDAQIRLAAASQDEALTILRDIQSKLSLLFSKDELAALAESFNE